MAVSYSRAAITKHRFGKSQLPPAGNKATSVDTYLQRAVVFGVGELSNAGLKGLCIRDTAADDKGKRDGIEVGVTITTGHQSLGFVR